LQYSSEAFIEKASGIKSNYVLNKQGVLDLERMKPVISDRSHDKQAVPYSFYSF